GRCTRAVVRALHALLKGEGAVGSYGHAIATVVLKDQACSGEAGDRDADGRVGSSVRAGDRDRSHVGRRAAGAAGDRAALRRIRGLARDSYGISAAAGD